MSRPTQDTSRRSLYFAYRTFTFFSSDFHQIRLYIDFLTPIRKSYNPNSEELVWAVPSSLATTKGIDFSFFSSGYLDVSVRRVSLSNAIDSR